ncbi:MAG: stage II sporulation protein P [Bacilli bacterium]|nr:stage II sporulation protein P [Bacilli bacterium]
MKKRFIAKGQNKNKKLKRYFLFFMFIFGIYLSYKYLESKSIELKDKEFVNLLIDNSFKYNETDFIEKIANKTYELSNPVKLLSKEYNKYLDVNESEPVIKEETPPKIYLYNTHQTEEYQSNELLEFTIKPTVMINNYILEDIFNRNNYPTIVEERSIKEILNNNNWKYASSYKASRILLEDTYKNNTTLEYFIDIHRDSLKHDRTHINIEGKDYAKILFIIGTENTNYLKNQTLTEKINNKLNEYYPGLSKGILKKGGEGVNGIYNQDFNENVILIEIGGYESTTTEVLNSSLAFAKCFMEAINE